MDDFDRAMKELAKSDDKETFKGIELINVKLIETLKSNGLEILEVKAGDVFDADIHEAITQIPAPDKKMKGKIIDVIEKGFKLGDRIIRHPKVVVGN
jgi:molecular chaperone GrpE